MYLGIPFLSLPLSVPAHLPGHEEPVQVGVVRKEEQGLVGARKLVGSIAWGARQGQGKSSEGQSRSPEGRGA